MQVVESARPEARGGAPVPPPGAHEDIPPLVLVPPTGADPASARRQAFGRRLAAARERRGVAVETIAQRMKVSPGLLTSIERGDASRWPKGIFRRAFFRDYVMAIGLPAEPYVSEFLHLFPDGEQHPVATPPPSDAPALRLALEIAPGWRPNRATIQREFLTLVPVLILALLVAVVSGGGVWMFLTACLLCYYWRIAPAVTRRISARLKRPPARSE